MIFCSFYWAKTAFVSLLMMSSITFESTCSGSVSDLFNSLIVGITSANEGEHSAASNSNQRPLELKLADAQMLQQWIGQIARKIVVEDGIFAGIYSCGPNINIDGIILTDRLPEERIKNLLKKVQNSEEKIQFLKLLFSFGAMLSAEIGEQSQQNGTLRALLKAYECVGGQFAEEKDGVSDFAIGAVIKSPIEQLKVDKIILEKDNRRHIQELALLNSSKTEMTPTDVINFAYFITSQFLKFSPTDSFVRIYQWTAWLPSFGTLIISSFGEDLIKYRRMAHQLLLHLKNLGPEELEEISLKKSIKLTQREKCIFGIFTRNLLRRIAKFELLEDYFNELNISEHVLITKYFLKVYEEFSADNCKKVQKNEGIENSKIYPFFDEAIRIDWNVWTEIIQQIDELTKTVKSKDTKQVAEYLKRANENEGPMKIVKAKFDEKEFGLELKAKVKVDNETTLEDEINQFCLNLAEIRQICEEKIEKYEKENPFKRNVRIKQKENDNKFYDFMAIVVEHFGRNSFKNDGKSIEFDLNGAKSFLEKVYNSAINQIVKKNESEEYECLSNENLNFETVIRAILDQNLNEKVQNLVKEFYVPKEFVKIPRKSAEKEGGLKHFLELDVEAQLFNLFFSFAARLEAIVHGKNIDGTIEKSRENSKDKIRAFLAVPNCFNVPERANKFSIFYYWMEIKELNSKESQMPVIGVAIYKDIFKEARSLLQKNYKTLKRLNEYKFSFYESTKLLRKIYDQIEKKHSTLSGLIIPEMAEKLTYQIWNDFDLWHRKHDTYFDYEYRKYISGCEYAKLFQNISANFMKMKGVTLHMDKLDSDIQADVERNFGKYCKIIERNGRKVEETKIALLNNVRYDLVINFKFNAWKDIRDRTEDLLGNLRSMEPSKEDPCTIEKEITMPYHFTAYQTNRKSISKIEALKAKENDGFDLMELFDRLDELARKVIDEEMPNLKEAKKELETLEQSESAEIYKKKRLFEETENFKRQIEDKEKEANNLKNEINLLQEKLDKMPEKQRENAANFLEWFKSNEEAKITDESKQILREIYELSKLYIKVRKLIEKISDGIGSTSQKRIENDKNITMANLISVTAHKLNIELKMDLVELKLEVLGVLLELAQEIDKNLDKNLLDVLKYEKNKTQLTTKMEAFEYEETVEKLRERIEKVSHGVVGELDALLSECKIELGEKELKSKEEELKNLKEKLLKMKKEFAPKIEEIDKKLSKLMEKEQTLKEYKLNILKGSISKMNETIAHKNAQIEKINKILRVILMKKEEVNTLEKELKENKESVREMRKSLGQMLENVKKLYGQKMDE